MAHKQTKVFPEIMVSVAVIAEVLGVTRRRVSQLVTENVLLEPVNHKYDALRCAAAYIEFKNAKAQQGGTSAEELRKARAELLRAQRKTADLVYKQKTGELLDIETVEALLIEGTATFAGQKRAMSSRLAGKLSNMTDPKAILKLLNAENDAILKNTADKFGEIKDLGKGFIGIDAAAGSKSERVGRRKSSVSARKPRTGASPE